VIPIDLHSSSHSSFNVPFDGSWYSFGMAFSIAFGSWTCRYSNSLSEYLKNAISFLPPNTNSNSPVSVQDQNQPRRIVNGVNIFLQCLLLPLRKGSWGLVSPVVVHICHQRGRCCACWVVVALARRGTGGSGAMPDGCKLDKRALPTEENKCSSSCRPNRFAAVHAVW
jgi:hypothetical protein